MAKVGKKIGKKTQAGKDVYKTPEGKNVSEMSTTFKYKGKWINVPSIHKGYEYDVKTLKMMLDAEVIKPTSTHDSRTEAEAEARDRSDRLKFDEGGLATEEERLGFAKSYGVEPVEPMDLTFKDAAKTIAEFTPIIGDVMAAKEVYDELQKDEPNYLLVGALGGAALIGLIPGLGDAAAAAIKTGARKALDVGKRIEVDPDAVGMMGGNVRIKPKTAANQPNIISFTEKRKEITEAKELQDTYDALNADVKGIAKRKQKLVKEAEQVGVFGEYEVGATVQGRNKKGPLPFKIEGHSLDEVKLDSPSFKRLQDKADGNLTIIEKDGKYYIPKLITSNEKGQKGSSYLDLVKLNNYPIMGKLGVVYAPRAAIKEGVPTVEAAGLTDEAIEAWRKEYETPEAFRKALKGRNPELQAQATRLGIAQKFEQGVGGRVASGILML